MDEDNKTSQEEQVPKFEDTTPVYEETSPIEETVAKAMGIGEPTIEGFEAFQLGLADPLGFGGELSGATGAVLELAAGERQPDETRLQQMMRTYQEYRQPMEQRIKLAQQQEPAAYLGGGMAGGFALPGFGQFGRAVPMGRQIISGAKTGAGYGALSGLGTTEDITDVPQVAQDVAIGTAVGTGLGMLAPPVVETTKKFATGGGEMLGELGSLVVGPVKEASKIGYRGDYILTQEGRKAALKEFADFAEQYAPRLKNEVVRLAKLKNKIIDQASEKGIPVNEEALNARLKQAVELEPESQLPEVRREFEELQELIRTHQQGRPVRRVIEKEMPTGKEKVRQIEELKIAEQNAIESGVDPVDIDTVFEEVDVEGQVAAVVRQRLYDKEGNPAGYKKLASRLIQEDEIPQIKTITETVRDQPTDLTRLRGLEQLRKDVRERSQFGKAPFKTEEVQREAGQLEQFIKETQREAKPELSRVDEAIRSLKEAGESIGIDTQDLKPQQIKDRILSLLAQEDKATISGLKASEKFGAMVEKIREVNPRWANELEREISRLGAKEDVIRQAGKPLSFISPLSATRSLGTRAAGGLGYAAGRASETMMKGINWTKAASPDWMNTMARHIAETGDNELSRQLSEMLFKNATKEERARQAFLFGLLQNPAYREKLQDYIPQKEEQ